VSAPRGRSRGPVPYATVGAMPHRHRLPVGPPDDFADVETPVVPFAGLTFDAATRTYYYLDDRPGPAGKDAPGPANPRPTGTA